MSGPAHFITDVSDTARWTALHRATESARADALFSDPLAERLTGERGRAIVDCVSRTTRNGWWLVARTKIIDDVISEAIADGCDRVLNLAAGLDTGPHRLLLGLGTLAASTPDGHQASAANLGSSTLPSGRLPASSTANPAASSAG